MPEPRPSDVTGDQHGQWKISSSTVLQLMYEDGRGRMHEYEISLRTNRTRINTLSSTSVWFTVVVPGIPLLSDYGSPHPTYTFLRDK